MNKERRFLLKAMATAGAAFGLNLLPNLSRPALADVRHAGESDIQSPQQQILSYTTEVLSGDNHTPDGTVPSFNESTLKGFRRFETIYKPTDNKEIFIAFNATTDGKPVFMAVSLTISGIIESAINRLSDQRLMADFAENFTPITDTAAALPWTRSTSPHLSGNPLVAEKIWPGPGGYMESRGATLTGEGDSRQIRLMAARAYEGSKQFTHNTAFIPT